MEKANLFLALNNHAEEKNKKSGKRIPIFLVDGGFVGGAFGGGRFVVFFFRRLFDFQKYLADFPISLVVGVAFPGLVDFQDGLG